MDEIRFQVRAFETAPWMADAACKGRPTSWWFPDNSHDRSAKLARTICRTCPVHQDCLTFALERNDEGIWAGLTMRQRRKMRRNTKTTKTVFCPGCNQIFQTDFEARNKYCSSHCQRQTELRRNRRSSL